MDEHGEFQLWVDDTIVYAIIGGSWNAETAMRFKQEFIDLVSNKITEPWAHLVMLDDWVLGTPDIEPIIQSLTHWCVEHGALCAAQVFSPSMIKRYQLNKMVTDELGKFMRRQFSNLEAAAQWLHDEGFAVSEINQQRLAKTH